MTDDELNLICRIWADKGSGDPTGRWIELWDGGDAADYPVEREVILRIASECGLQARIENGVLWVEQTQQLQDAIVERALGQGGRDDLHDELFTIDTRAVADRLAAGQRNSRSSR